MGPGDLYYLQTRAQHKGERSVDALGYLIGSALDLRPVLLGYRGDTQVVARARGYLHAVERMFAHVARQTEIGIDTRHPSVSYGGELDALAAMPGYAALPDLSARHGTALVAGLRAVVSALKIGLGAERDT